MMFINIKPADRSQVYETEEQAIQHLFLFACYAQKWEDGRPFGQRIADIRRVNEAIKSRDFTAFRASRRRGYWRVEIAA